MLVSGLHGPVSNGLQPCIRPWTGNWGPLAYGDVTLVRNHHFKSTRMEQNGEDYIWPASISSKRSSCQPPQQIHLCFFQSETNKQTNPLDLHISFVPDNAGLICGPLIGEKKGDKIINRSAIHRVMLVSIRQSLHPCLWMCVCPPTCLKSLHFDISSWQNSNDGGWDVSASTPGETQLGIKVSGTHAQMLCSNEKIDVIYGFQDTIKTVDPSWFFFF